MKIDLKLALRATEVKRWTIVKLSREQSVAEHQYRVWLIATAMWDALFTVPHNSLEQRLLWELALTHDLHEVLTGDIPSPLKESSPELGVVIDAAEEKARRTIGVLSLAPHRATVAGCVLRIADCAEALLFMFQNGGLDRPSVLEDVRRRFLRVLEAAPKAHPSLDWTEVKRVVAILDEDPRWMGLVEVVR